MGCTKIGKGLGLILTECHAEPCTPKPPRVYPPAGPVIDDTQEALFDLEDTLLQHETVVQGNVGQGVGTSEAGPSHTQDPHTRSLVLE